jgi:hypothetical protein
VGVEDEELLPPHPTAPIAATDKTTARRAPHRRRRGTVRRIIPANVAPEPAAYHGAPPSGLECGAVAAELVTKAVTTNEVVTAPLVEVMEIGVTVKEVVALMTLLGLAIRLTDPVNPLTGVMVKVIPEEVPPGRALVDAVQGLGAGAVIVKSGCVVETMSTDARAPSVARTAALEPA